MFVIDLPDEGRLMVAVPADQVAAFEQALLDAGPDTVEAILAGYGARVERV